MKFPSKTSPFFSFGSYSRRLARGFREFISGAVLAALVLTSMTSLAGNQPFTDADWLNLGAEAGVNGSIAGLVTDTSGNVYVAGGFSTAGSLAANEIARWNGTNWSNVGVWVASASIKTLAVDGAGILYAGGAFTNAGGVAATNIARWDGAHWSALGLGGKVGSVLAVAADGLGNVYVGGNFTNFGGVAATNVAKWNGSSWSALGIGVKGTQVNSLVLDSAGNLYAGGVFTNAGGSAITNIAKWNGTSWSGLGSGVPVGSVVQLAADNMGNLYVGGTFTNAGGVGGTTNVAKWNGSAWSALGTGVTGAVTAIGCDNLGNVCTGGSSGKFGTNNYKGVAEWNGTSWSAMAGGMAPGFAQTLAIRGVAFDQQGNVYVGGAFNTAGSATLDNVARWDGSQWSSLGLGIAGNGIRGTGIDSLATDSAGNLYVGGPFQIAFGANATNIAKFNGSGWSALGNGLSGLTFGYNGSPGAITLVCDNGGSLYAGGVFTTAGNVAALNIARWDGTNWHALGAGFGIDSGSSVESIAVDSSNYVYAAGVIDAAANIYEPHVKRWDGTNWADLGLATGKRSLGSGSQVEALLAVSSNVYYSADFTNMNGVAATNICRWNGTSWSALGTGLGSRTVGYGLGYSFVGCLAADSAGNVYAGGSFINAGNVGVTNIAKWDGTAWSQVGGGLGGSNDNVNSIVCDKSGNLYATGTFTNAGPTPVSHIARWDGIAWSPLGSGMDLNAFQIAIDTSGNLLICGRFTRAGTNSSLYLAKAVLQGPAPGSLTIINIGGTTNIITYLGNPGLQYALDLTTSLSIPPEWIAQATNAPSTNNAATSGYVNYTNAGLPPQGFYRVRSVQ